MEVEKGRRLVWIKEKGVGVGGRDIRTSKWIPQQKVQIQGCFPLSNVLLSPA